MELEQATAAVIGTQASAARALPVRLAASHPSSDTPKEGKATTLNLLLFFSPCPHFVFWVLHASPSPWRDYFKVQALSRYSFSLSGAIVFLFLSPFIVFPLPSMKLTSFIHVTVVFEKQSHLQHLALLPLFYFNLPIYLNTGEHKLPFCDFQNPSV